jgi:hypothetical protein
MAWELLTADTPKMWGKKGVISWNDATHRLMGNPQAVEIFYDEDGERIGFHGVYYRSGLQVKQTDDMRFSIDASEYLDEAGLDLPNNWEAGPEVEPLDEESIPGTLHTHSVVWIVVPE